MTNNEYNTDTRWICRHCGDIINGGIYFNGSCTYCGASMIDTHKTHLDSTHEELLEKFVYNHPLFSKEAFVAREAAWNERRKLDQVNMERHAKGLPSLPKDQPKCPICGSTKLRKIDAINKVGSVALFGIFSAGHVSKTWHCKNCNSEF